MKSSILSIAIASLFLLSVNVHAQSLYYQAWESINQGDLNKAAELFRQEAESNNNPDAYIALAYIYDLQTRGDQAWDSFKKALSLLDDPVYYLMTAMNSETIIDKMAEMDDYLVNFLYKMTEDTSDGFINNYAHERLGNFLMNNNHIDEALKLFKEMEVVRDWSVIGPFDNISESGYDTEYPPEKEFDRTKQYKGKNNDQLSWYDLKKTRNDGWIDFMNYLNTSNAVFYANTFVWSPQKQKVQLRIGTSGSVKLFLNDLMLLKNREERNNNSDTYICETWLQEGWNRVLVKSGLSEISRCNFMLRITDERGFTVKGLKFSTDPQPYKKVLNENSSIVESELEKYFKARLQKDSLNPLNYILMALVYQLNDKRYDVEKTYSSALNKFPDNVMVSALFYNFLDSHGKNVRANSIDAELKLRKVQIPRIELWKLLQSAVDQNKDNIISCYEKIKFEIPETGSWLYIKLIYSAYKKLVNDFYSLVDSAYQQYPHNEYIFFMKFYLEYNRTHDLNKGLSVFEDFCERNTNKDVLKILAAAYLNASRINDWERIYKQLIRCYPSDGELYNQMAQVYYSGRDFEKAVEFEEKALEMSPDEPAYHYNMGLYKMGLNEKEDAKKCFREAIQHYPYFYEARDALREINGPEPIENEIKPFDINKIISENTGTNGADGNDAEYLLMDGRSKYYDGGAYEEEWEEVVKVLTPKGVEDFSYVTYYTNDNQKLTIEKAVTIKPDGKEIKAELNDNQAVFNSLEPGDFVYWKLRKGNYNSGILNEHFYTLNTFSKFYPVKKARFSLEAPEGIKFNFSGNNMQGEPSDIKSADGKKLYVWEMNNLPAIDHEYSMPSLIDVGNTLYISTIRDWDVISKWYYNVTRSKIKEHYEVKNKVNELLKGKEQLSDNEKVKIIYDYITKNISYVFAPFRQSATIPRNAVDVLADKTGDCKDVVTLFIAMLNEAGIKADYVLTLTSENGSALNSAPCFLFNHLIAVTYLDGKKQYFDLTAADYPYGVLPSVDRGAFVLEVTGKKDEPHFIDPTNSLPTIISRKTDVVLNADNTASVKTMTNRKGEAVASFLSDFQNLTQEKILKKMTEAYSDDFSDYTVTGVEIDSLDGNNEINYLTTLELNNFISEAGNYKLFKIPWITELNPNQALSYQKRKYGYRMYYIVDEFKEDITISLPEGYEPLELPENVNLSCSTADCCINYSYKDNKISGQTVLSFKEFYVPPEKYQEFKDFYNALVSKHSVQILLKQKNK